MSGLPDQHSDQHSRDHADQHADPDAAAAAFQSIAAGVAVASTRWRGVDHAITVTSYTWVSREPPVLLVCVHEDARFLDAVEEAGVWGLSLLPDSARAVANWLATPGRPARGQLDRVPHQAGPVTGVPLLDGCLATFECRTTAVHPAGDHAVVLGLVVGLGQSPTGPSTKPLVRFARSYHALV
ncbi:NADH-FMN oxidoreductase RutF, flavin reductase (DIM6/NTAB) family [Quadrisphaera granulorum]|uniref:Flavin reductase (DIM6/NTAB) family NADH-FMN oxidoreductase RutF n=1 Tax=Quadrisphaera granulorum TaxID=317664 RepID=A0A316AEZ5_9ACTN|nr:flavin reductase family protein [Quadrisphaera granulorum]PWJ56171.1 flavin reductase (DIM6/NTAB) family NADH-FMN oxidoreductase RutF [Quadrisphaera granulorum]SZE94805.1 NADH-FMN oxidoreductase RutF, flavin reductase (DIM6/NTAB) family [Quadrisphaera granulorum]